MLKKQSPGVVLIVSYADQNQDHHGGIYQGGNWVYVGESGKAQGGNTAMLVMPSGEVLHKRVASARYGVISAEKLGASWFQPKEKHKYLYPLTPEMRAKIEPLAKPYPKRASEASNHPDQGQGGGLTPTRTLHPSSIATSER